MVSNHQGRRLVDGGVFEVTVGGDGLKDFRIDSPTAATELMNEQRRGRAEFEIGLAHPWPQYPSQSHPIDYRCGGSSSSMSAPFRV
jgi:hypothetical protein